MLTRIRDRAPSRADAGLSLVEVMVAMGVFVVGSLSLLTVLSGSARSSFDNRARVTAANLAASDIDEARSRRYADLAVGVTSTPVVVDGRTYTVEREVRVTMAGAPTAASACAASGTARQLHKRVSTSVTTAFRTRTQPVRSDTLVKAPVFDATTENGALGFFVLDRDGLPLAGVTVSIPGTTRTTDSNGCAFFDQLPPGTYVVTVTRPGSVTRDGRTVMTKPVVVNKGQITPESLRIDNAITVTVRARAFTGLNPSPPSETGLPWQPPTAQVRLTTPDRATTTATTHSERKTMTGADLVWKVFPSPAGYDAHIGACSVVAHFDSEPATNPVVDLPLSPVVVHLKGPDDYKTAGRSITATWGPPSSSQPACTEVLTWSVTTTTGCASSAALLGNSCRLDLALPAGSWQLKVSQANGGAVPWAGAANVVVGARAARQTVEIDVP